MTKEIIINGVNISECKYRRDGIFTSDDYCRLYELHEYDHIDCKDNPNCYFKRLKRKEQECEEINLTNERLVAEKYTLNEEILRFNKKVKSEN